MNKLRVTYVNTAHILCSRHARCVAGLACAHDLRVRHSRVGFLHPLCYCHHRCWLDIGFGEYVIVHALSDMYGLCLYWENDVMYWWMTLGVADVRVCVRLHVPTDQCTQACCAAWTNPVRQAEAARADQVWQAQEGRQRRKAAGKRSLPCERWPLGVHCGCRLNSAVHVCCTVCMWLQMSCCYVSRWPRPRPTKGMAWPLPTLNKLPIVTKLLAVTSNQGAAGAGRWRKSSSIRRASYLGIGGW